MSLITETATALSGATLDQYKASADPVIFEILAGWRPTGPVLEEAVELALSAVGTASHARVGWRGWAVRDWIARVYVPAWLEVGGCARHATWLRALAPVTRTTCQDTLPRLSAAGTEAADVRLDVERQLRHVLYGRTPWPLDHDQQLAFDAAARAIKVAAEAAYVGAVQHATGFPGLYEASKRGPWSTCWNPATALLDVIAIVAKAPDSAVWLATLEAGQGVSLSVVAERTLRPVVVRLQHSLLDLIRRLLKRSS